MNVTDATTPAGSDPPALKDVPDKRSYDIGAPVSCEDGACGELSRIVVDPINLLPAFPLDGGPSRPLAAVASRR